VLVGGLCWLLLFVAGCSGSEPSPAPTSRHPGTAATSTPTSPSADPTDIAAAAAIAAVKKLYAELNLAIHSGKTTQYRQTFTNRCSICVHDADVTDSIYRKGQRVDGGTYRLDKLVVVWNKPDLVIVQGVLSATPLTVRKGTHVITRDSALKPSAFTWDVVPHSGSWLVSKVVPLR
jgi:hypothetical protein